MSLKLYYHPLASFCWKVLIPLYENGVPFEGHIVDLADERSRADFLRIWPIGNFPVLRDEARERTIPESSTIIEYLDQHYPGPAPLLPADPDLARQVRFRDRFYDHYVHQPMQKIVTDRIRPQGRHDPHGVEEAGALLRTALRHDRRGHGLQDLGDGGGLRHGRLRRRTGAVLCRQGVAVRGNPRQCRGVSAAPDAAPVLCPRHRGGAALFQVFSRIVRKGGSVQLAPGVSIMFGRRDRETGAMTVTIYHNPKCGTSRNVLAMIRESGAEPEVIEYLKTPPSRKRLAELIKAMGLTVREVLRRKGTPYEELGLDDPKWTEGQLIDLMVEHPILINRPIVVTPRGARLCRPASVVLESCRTRRAGVPLQRVARRRPARRKSAAASTA